jgi:hypothetical protein
MCIANADWENATASGPSRNDAKEHRKAIVICPMKQIVQSAHRDGISLEGDLD